MSDERQFLRTHLAHDYEHLMERWRAVALKTGLGIETFAGQEEYPVQVLRRDGPLSDQSVYLCAGVHGDEPAGGLGLVEWAEQNTQWLAESDALVFPCFNPWGLVNNSRNDSAGRDLNRLFHSETEPLIREWRELIGEQRFRLALTLHEDYDAQGLYIYEISNRGEHIAGRMIERARRIIDPDPRRDIDGSEAENGVIHRDVTPENFPLPGLPEAVHLHFHHAETSMTIETPSEFSLYDRVRTHRVLIAAALELSGAGAGAGGSVPADTSPF